MKKFEFTLQGVLEIKQNLEGQAKVDFGVAQAKLNEELAKRDALTERQNIYRAQLKQFMTGTLNLTEISRCSDAIDVLEEEILSQTIVIKRAEKRVELARSRLNTLIMERKSIEKLREKKFAEYIAQYNEEERKQVDELVSYRHGVALRSGDY